MTGPMVIFRGSYLPRVQDVIDAALTRVAKPPAAWACRHVLGGEIPGLCIDHPALGLMCIGCVRDHDVRHDDAARHRCDGCGCQSGRMHDQTCTVAVNLNVRVPRGQRGRYVGPLIVAGLGVCPGCYSRATGLMSR